MRKIVDFKVHNQSGYGDPYTTVALCDDGTMWQHRSHALSDPWLRFSDIPQDNPTPVLELTPDELAEIENARKSWACVGPSGTNFPDAVYPEDAERRSALASALDKVLSLAGKKDGQ